MAIFSQFTRHLVVGARGIFMKRGSSHGQSTVWAVTLGNIVSPIRK